jgi:hypothetical protein
MRYGASGVSIYLALPCRLSGLPPCMASPIGPLIHDQRFKSHGLNSEQGLCFDFGLTLCSFFPVSLSPILSYANSAGASLARIPNTTLFVLPLILYVY